MRFSIYQDSLVGARASNQDRMGYCYTRDSLLMMVADGMGGHLRGEVAAHLALQSAAACFQAEARLALDDPAAFLDRALRRAHRDILRYQALHDLPEAPRTTIVACIVQDGRAWWAHAGDSRLYFVRGARLMRRTRDHSKVQNLIDLGQLDPRESDTHPERNKVLNCLGSPCEPTIELGGDVALEPGDAVMLCSDGVWSALGEAEIVERLSSVPVPSAVSWMVQRSVENAGMGADNATALAMTWEGDETRVSSLSSHDVPEGAITTTIAVGLIDEAAPGEAMSEDEIERTIREIREAIARTNGS